MRVLLVDDDVLVRGSVARILRKGDYDVCTAPDGRQALDVLKREPIDAVLTDWMMPEMDGIELVRRIRAEIRPAPVVIMITALNSDDAREHALQVGADAYLAKPFSLDEVLAVLANCLRRRHQKPPQAPHPSAAGAVTPAATREARPPYVAVALAASTGGPPALTELFKHIMPNPGAAYFVVLHAPAWALSVFAERLAADAGWDVRLSRDGMLPEGGRVYLAPGGRHMLVVPDTFTLQLSDDPPENHVRPSADPLLRSLAQAAGKYCVAGVLTGLGCDGSLGAAAVADAGGVVLVQDPETAVAPYMPRSVIELGVRSTAADLPRLGRLLTAHVEALSRNLA